MGQIMRLIGWQSLMARVVPSCRAELVRQLDAIFFEASATYSFASASQRDAFRQRWLGRYLDHYPAFAHVAVEEGPQGFQVLGYVVGSVDDPARHRLFADIDYFQTLNALTCDYPAHLHINLAPGARGHGLGGRLVRRFAAQAFMHGAGGVHVVTGAASRNVGFYHRLGLTRAHAFDWGDVRVLMLAGALPLVAPRVMRHRA